jgi:hypothetical protein
MVVDMIGNDVQRPPAPHESGRFVGWAPLAIVALLIARLPLLRHRRFDPDELEHAHTAWCWARGLLPYRDFFEHHTPWYPSALKPLFEELDAAGSLAAATRFLLLARCLALALTAVALILVVAIGRLWADRRVGLLAALLLAGQFVFLQKTVEARPDVPALVFYLAAIALLLWGARPTETATESRHPWFVASGLSLGAAIMCTQKILFVVPGALAGLGVWTLSAPRGEAPRRLLSTLLFAAAILVPGVLTWAAFAWEGAGREFIANNFLLNARWKHIATNQLRKLATTSWPLLGLAAVASAMLAPRVLRGLRERQHGQRPDTLLLFSIMLGLFLEVPFMPSAHRQYYLIPLPLVALFAARGLLLLIDRTPQAKRAWLLGGALVALAIHPALALREAFHDRNDVQLARLAFVFDHTAPTDPVMDGWEGMGVFRPHAFRYFFLHEETLAMLPHAALDAYLDALETGAVRPRLIALDKNLRALGPRFLAWVAAHYTTSDGFFYVAREPPH